MKTSEEERGAIQAAMDRLLAGTPSRSDGALTIVSLAIEADVKRHLLTHKYLDLKDEFYGKVRAQNGVSEREQKLIEEKALLAERIDGLRAERDALKADVERFARVVRILEVENSNLRKELDRGGKVVRPMPSRSNA